MSHLLQLPLDLALAPTSYNRLPRPRAAEAVNQA